MNIRQKITSLAIVGFFMLGALIAGQPASAASNQLCSSGWPYATAKISVYGVPYYIATGNYGGHYECLTLNGTRPAFQITRSFWVDPIGRVQAYPNIATSYHLPAHIWGLSPRVTWSFRTNRAPGAWNASIEMWINKAPTVVGHPNGAEIMVWLDKQGPASFYPSRGLPIVRVNGTQWYVQTWRAHVMYKGAAIWWNYVQFRRVHLLASAYVNAMPMAPFYWAAEKRHLLDNRWYLESMQVGNEIWRGGDKLQTSWVSVSGLPASGPAKSNTQILNWASAS